MGAGGLGGLLGDLQAVAASFTRLPVGHPSPSRPLGPALWAAPLVGLLVGAVGGLGYWLAVRLGLPGFIAAVLAVALQLLVTGAFHEDGLADVADGFGGGRGAERKLEIMRDSRLGTYGALALAVLLLLRMGTIASLGTQAAFLALLAAGAAARAPLALVMRWLPPARRDGLGAGAGRPPPAAAVAALVLGAAILLAAVGPFLGWARALVALAAVALVTIFWAMLSRRQIGGYTGDLLGALAATAEAAVLLAAAANP